MTGLVVNQRNQQVARYAEEHIRASAQRVNDQHSYAGADYRWQHTLRVANYGMQIAEAEGANVELVAAACLLHDSEWFSEGHDHDHGRIAAREIRPFLYQVGYSTEEVENICYSVAVHVDGKADFEHADTLEAKVVSDADNVDRFGAYRVLFWCLDDMNDYNKLIAKLTARIQRLEEYRSRQVLETVHGNRLFDRQLELQIDFFKKLVEEHAITHLPG